MRKTNLLLLLFLFIAGQLFAGIIYVKPGEESSAWEGKKNVYTSIAEAYAASKNMDEIWVSAGTYQLEATIALASKTVSFYGGFAGTESMAAERALKPNGNPWDFVNETIIEPGASFPSGKRLIESNSSMGQYAIDGFIFQKNNNSVAQVRNGGAIRNCIFRNNTGNQLVRMWGNCSLENSYVHDNTVNVDGAVWGGGNSATQKAKILNVRIENNVYGTGNTGCAVFCYGNVAAVNCVISGTNAGADKRGSAIYVGGAGGEFIQILVYNNNGIPVYCAKPANFINCTLVNNDASAGLMTLNGISSVYNCVMIGNGEKAIDGSVSTSKIANLAADFEIPASVEKAYPMTFDEVKFIAPTSFKGVPENITEEQKTELANADWRVTDESAIINLGKKSYFPLDEYEVDLAGNDRVLNTNIDLGVYETASEKAPVYPEEGDKPKPEGKYRYVKESEESTAWSNMGLPEANIFTSLAEAIASVEDGAGEIWIAKGTYKMSATLDLIQGVNIYGGFAGTETDIEQREKGESGYLWDFVNETIIEPAADFSGTRLINQAGTSGSVATIVDGITVQNSTKGSAFGIATATTVQNCIFRNNVGTEAGIAATLYSRAILKDSYVYNNKSDNGAVYTGGTNASNIAKVLNVRFEGNTYNTKIENGVGLRANQYSNIQACEFYNNSSKKDTDMGRGSAIYSHTATNEFYHCLIYNNDGLPVFLNGGKFLNATIANNRCNEAIYLAGTDRENVVANCLVIGNRTIEDKPAKAVDIASAENTGNTVASLGTDYEWETTPSYIKNSYTLTANEVKFVAPTDFVGISTTDEQKAMFSAEGWKVEGTSEIIDKGDNSFWSDAAPMFDFDGNNRFQDGAIDLGVYETKKDVSVSIENNEMNACDIYAVEGGIIVDCMTNAIMEIYNVAGQVIESVNIEEGQNRYNLASGIYIIHLKVADGIVVRKVLVQ
ncbi:T9SS type A sorting domain-containing protein [Coprobacter secundus]|uniref:T9SS type A sorting domain-containing protein n=1 Tax=Coprobacter secundus TaxID=1501392 RepID=UPI0022E8D867|nr:T9SS type A sorting domain-containing protein [Coprobacter secundus]